LTTNRQAFLNAGDTIHLGAYVTGSGYGNKNIYADGSYTGCTSIDFHRLE
jgi:hypothetical protein